MVFQECFDLHSVRLNCLSLEYLVPRKKYALTDKGIRDPQKPADYVVGFAIFPILVVSKIISSGMKSLKWIS